MKKKWTERLIALAIVTTVAVSSVIAFGTGELTQVNATTTATTASVVAGQTTVPKYVFMFIGDGMSYPQIQIASDYLGALNQKEGSTILTGGEPLSFMEFDVAGSAITYDSTSFAPDSASTATSMATGKKTHSGVINMDESKTIAYESITEKLKDQLDYKIGVVSSVNLNHATPAAFYAHQASRNSYYEIGVEMVESNFDYFAGGGLKQTTGKNSDQEDVYTLAANAGYKVVKTQSDAEKVSSSDGKVIIIDEHLADSDAMSYENDRAADQWGLKDYVKKGIEVLDNDNGFFMMVEGGKIDWAAHANDAGSTIADVIALDEAVKEAIKFYNEHPTETLILVTGDHETGALSIGYAGTDHDIYLTNLQNQKTSYAKFDSDYVSKYKENSTSFEDVLVDVKELFGLTVAGDTTVSADSKLILTDYEYAKLKAAYDKTMSGKAVDKTNQEEYVLYGTYEPLTVTITHLLNNKSGINFGSYGHTGLPVGVFAEGVGEDLFSGYYDNTDIYNKLAALLGVK